MNKFTHTLVILPEQALFLVGQNRFSHCIKRTFHYFAANSSKIYLVHQLLQSRSMATDAKQKYLSMPLEEKRREYFSKKFITLDEIPTWPDYCQKNNLARLSSDGKIKANPEFNKRYLSHLFFQNRLILMLLPFQSFDLCWRHHEV